MRTATSLIRRVATTGLVIGALSLTAAACGSDSSDGAADTTAGAAETTAPAAGEITVEGQWARNSPMGAANGAAYFTVTASADDTMTGVSVDPSIAATAEMHETVMAMGSETTMAMGSETTMGMGTETTMNMGGGMTMQPVESIPLKAGEPFVLEPGGYHIMLMELAEPLEIGQTITLTLSFENAGDIDVEVPVLEEAP